MAEFTRGQDWSRNEDSGHNKKAMEQARRRIPGVDFEELNFEQRRAPYGNSGRNGMHGPEEDRGQGGRRRDDL